MQYSDPKALAEAKFKVRADQEAPASQAMREYRAKQQAEIDRIARLRELRLAQPAPADGHVVQSAATIKRKSRAGRRPKAARSVAYQASLTRFSLRAEDGR
jgi:hypothetical protein